MSKFIFMLAPLEDITNDVLRSVCHKYGADLTFTEMTRIDALAKNNAAAMRRIIQHDMTPYEIQLLGSNENNLSIFLSGFKPMNNFKGFNLNISCPSPQVINIGQGAAMIKRVSKVARMVSTVKSAGFSCSVKLRMGLNPQERKNGAYLNLINGVDADYFILHARLGSDTYKVPADFSVYECAAKTGKTIIANGDITSLKDIEFLKSVGIKGAMIGRPAVSNPGIFSALKNLDVPKQGEIMAQYRQLNEAFEAEPKYLRNFEKFFQNPDFSVKVLE